MHAAASNATWLLVSNLACFDRGAAAAVLDTIREYASPRFHVYLNVFTTTGPCLTVPPALASYVTLFTQPGFKPIFWKYRLAPADARRFDYLILSDADIRFRRGLGFTLPSIDSWMRRTGAGILQPTVLAERSGTRAGSGDIGPGAYTADCVAQTSRRAVERVYVARPSAYEVFWKLLQRIPDHFLSTDTGLEGLWCALLRKHMPRMPACVILRHVSVVHLDTHAIRRQGHDRLYIAQGRKKGAAASNANNTLSWIMKHPSMRELLQNESWGHPSRSKPLQCWGAEEEEPGGAVQADMVHRR